MATTIKIGHAGSSSTGVYIKEDYDPTVSLNPYVVLRPKSKAAARRSALACEAACANDGIWYSLDDRNSLKAHIINTVGSLSDAKAIQAISNATGCNVDCASFMTVCAIVGGAKFSYDWGNNGYNAPVTSNMVWWFTTTDDYIKLTDSRYTSCTDYLKRGDILVKEDLHTVMVLENGSKVTDDIKLAVAVNKLGSNNIKASIKVSRLQDGKDVPVKSLAESEEDADIFKSYKWTYTIKPIARKTAEHTKEIAVDSAINPVTVKELTPNTSYYLRADATMKVDNNNVDNTIKFSSPGVIFTTRQSYPEPVKNLVIRIDNSDIFNKNIHISFAAPDSWGDSYSAKGYRLNLLINGKITSFSDTILKDAGSKIEAVIALKDIVKVSEIKYGDALQIGIFTWIKDEKGNIIYNINDLKCSQSVYIDYPLKTVDKTYIKVSNNFKRAIVDSIVT